MEYTRCAAEIKLSAIAGNINIIKGLIGSQTEIMAVVKADAYGHGALETSKTALASGASRLGVATADEGVFLREMGINAPILIFGVSMLSDVELAINYGLTQTVCDLRCARDISRAAARLSKTADVHIKIDTGMSRLGMLPSDESAGIVAEILSMPGLAVSGIYSHLADAENPDGSFAGEQLKRLECFLAQLKEKGINIPLVHISKSGSVLRLRGFDFDMVRLGIALYGLPPSSDDSGQEEMYRLGFEEALTFKARVSFVKTVGEGVTVGYSRTYKTSGPTKIATISAGYADGYSRHLSNRGRVLINGSFAPIIGNVCMDQFMVDATGISVNVGDEAVLLGRQGQNRITANEIAALQGTINYEVLTGISKRVPKKYI